MERKAIIVGAGPAGLTAAYELLLRTDIIPVILEQSGDIGGISKTVSYKGNRIDIGGHRFFSKSDRVMQWWMNIMPMEGTENPDISIHYHNQSRKLTYEKVNNRAKDPDLVMLIRQRISRIYFLRKFFSYPVQLSLDTLRKLGPLRTMGILFSYIKAMLFPIKPENSLEDFFINRFGVKLYELFFKDYTEKVWGVPCKEISAEWGAQRIKGVSISKAIAHAVQSLSKSKKTVKEEAGETDIRQKGTETSLIERFLYPKWGPGQLWEEVARLVKEKGGEIIMHHEVQKIHVNGNRVTSIEAINTMNGESTTLHGDYFFSTMPVQQLIAGMSHTVPEAVREVAAGLQYRDFITVGILLKRMCSPDSGYSGGTPITLKDTWIYIQERDVKVGRLQIFNNWSPFMVKDPGTIWIGMEYFCTKGDSFWAQPDERIKEVGAAELEKMGLARKEDVLDSTVLRMEKTYPAYFGTYDRFHLVQEYVDRYENLFLVGRNGMHKYNNSDHSMLTAMVAVDNIIRGIVDKSNIWAINTEQEYHEEKAPVNSSKTEAHGKVRQDEFAA